MQWISQFINHKITNIKYYKQKFHLNIYMQNTFIYLADAHQATSSIQKIKNAQMGNVYIHIYIYIYIHIHI